MNLTSRACMLLLAAACSWSVSAAAPAAELPRVPAGYFVEVVAEAPLVGHPMMACFDGRGRLFIAESAGTNRRAEQLLDDPLDFIRMLEDTDGDGAFDKSTVFADRLTFPQGVLCHAGAVYTCAPPNLWKLEDTDDDGVCDKRTVLVESFGFNGNAASIHGPFLGPQGRFYWCDGRHGHEFFNATGELVSKGKAARIFSCNPDGSDVRTFCGGGMDNPVEVDWLDSGEMIGTVNLFYGRPRGDVLVHWIEGGVYPRFDQQDCIDEFPWTGGLLPEIHNYGHVAVSGMCRVRASIPEAQSLRDAGGGDAEPLASFLVTQFNTHKVVRTTLGRDGSTFKAIAHEDLIVWDNPDVHPTDVLEDADGSFLVIDTGGWFRIGCPTSQIAKPEIPGAIYRINRSDSDSRETPADPVAAMPPPGPHEARLWLSEGTPPQRLAAAQQVAQVFAEAQAQPNPHSQRQFAAAVLAAAGADDTDRHLAHALVLALIRIDAPDLTRAALDDPDPSVRRTALIALDQMKGGKLAEADVAALLDTNDPQLLQAVLDVISRHEGWVAGTVAMFRQWLLAKSANEQRMGVMRAFFLAQAHDLWVQELVGDALTQAKTRPPIRRMLIDVVGEADVDPLPPLWVDGLGAALGMRSDPGSRLAALRTIGTRSLAHHDEALAEIALDADERPAERIEAFTALAPRSASVPQESFAFVMRHLIGEADLLERLTLARGVAAAPLDDAQLTELAAALEAIGPAVVPVLLPAFENSRQASVGAAVVEELTKLGESLSVSPQELERLLQRYPDSVQRRAEPLLRKLGVDVAAQAARLEQLAALTADAGEGHVPRGREVFFGRTAGCSTCHRVGDEGGQVGPALTNIGAIRQPRDLLEAIAFPSASFARDFRPYVIVTTQGRVHTGVMSATASDTVTLRTADLQEIRIPRKSIDVMQQSDTSIMPKGLETKLSAAELSDLLAYLQSLK